uniref:Uncharacterized protein n=1 Tax=Romanomermis culicivorax TaxID=13658 RepID=A0A915KT68_ROMCU
MVDAAISKSMSNMIRNFYGREFFLTTIKDHNMATEFLPFSVTEDELIKRRKDELKHAQEVRQLYENKLNRTNNLYSELNKCMLQVEQREKDLLKREKQFLNLLNAYGFGRKRTPVRSRLFTRPVWLRSTKNLDENSW